MTDERLIELAKQAAACDVERHVYIKYALDPDWAPHAWVVDAMRRAVAESAEALEKIAAIENKLTGTDWEEIEEARSIAREALHAPADRHQYAEDSDIRAAAGMLQAPAPAVDVQESEDAVRWRHLMNWMRGHLPMVRVQVMHQGQYQLRSADQLSDAIDSARTLTKG